MVTGSYDKTIGIWDVRQSNSYITPIYAHTNHVTGLKLFPDNMIVTCSEDCTIRVFDMRKTNQCVHRIDTNEIGFVSMTVSEDYSHVAVNTDHNSIFILAYKDIKNTTIGEVETLNELRGHLSANWKTTKVQYFENNLIASGSEDGSVYIWNESNERKQYAIHSTCVWNVSYSPTTRTLVSASEDGSCCLIDLFNYERTGITDDQECDIHYNPDYEVYQTIKKRKRSVKAPHLHQFGKDLLPCESVLVRYSDGYYYHAEVIDANCTKDGQVLFTCRYRDYSQDDPEPVVTVGSSLVVPGSLLENCSEDCIDDHTVHEILQASQHVHRHDRVQDNLLVSSLEPPRKKRNISTEYISLV